MSLEKLVQNTRTFLKNVRRLMSMITSVTLLKGCAHGSAKTGYYPWISMIHTLPHTDASQPVKSSISLIKMKTLFDEFEQEFIEINFFPSHFSLILLFHTLYALIEWTMLHFWPECYTEINLVSNQLTKSLTGQKDNDSAWNLAGVPEFCGTIQGIWHSAR